MRIMAGLALLFLLGGCASISATNKAAQCEAWRSIYYSSKDTKPTIKQVRVHNATWRKLCG